MAFVFVSGNLALDLAGTLKWRHDEREEQLLTPADLGLWAVAAEVVTERPKLTNADLLRARGLREIVYRTTVASIEGKRWHPEDIELINALAAAATPRPRLSRDTRTAIRTGDGDAVLAAVATAAIDLLSSSLTVRECARDRCTRLFVDRSRTANRRWCGMAECGNRIKAAEYRLRKKISQ